MKRLHIWQLDGRRLYGRRLRGRLALGVACVMALLVVAACGSSGDRRVPAPDPAAPQATPVGASTGILASRAAVTDGMVAGQVERLIVRTANLRIEVRNVEESVAVVEAIAMDVGGYVQSSNLDGLPENRRATITLRVPSERFHEAMQRLRAEADVVLSEQTSSSDVTEEYVDLSARLRNQQAVEREITELLERADTVSEVLSVQRELTNVRQEVERLQGRIQYLEQRAAESTIEVRLSERVPAIQVTRAWQPGSTFEGAAAALTQVFQGIGNVLIVGGVFAPIWAPLALGGLWLHRRNGGRRLSEVGRPGQQPLQQEGDSGD